MLDFDEASEQPLFKHKVKLKGKEGDIIVTKARIIFQPSTSDQSAAKSFVWANISNVQYSKNNEAKGRMILLKTIINNEKVVITLIGPSNENNQAELDRLKLIISGIRKNIVPVNAPANTTATAEPNKPTGQRFANKSQGIIDKNSKQHAITSAELLARQKLLEADKSLARQYKQLVEINKLVTETEFWANHSEALNDASFGTKSRKLQKGKKNLLLSDIMEKNHEGKIVVNLTVDKKQSIFLMYPEVRRAFEAEVPLKMNESEFWTKYFQNEYYTQGVGKGDEGGGDTSRSTQHYGGDDLFARYAVEKKDRNSSSTNDSGNDTEKGLKENCRRLAEHPVAPEFDLLSSVGDSYRNPNRSFDGEQAITGPAGGAYGTNLDLSKTASKYNKNSELVMSGVGTEREAVPATSTNTNATTSSTGSVSTDETNTLSKSLAFTEQNHLVAPDYIPIDWTSSGGHKKGPVENYTGDLADRDGDAALRSSDAHYREHAGEEQDMEESGAFAVSTGRTKRSFTAAGLDGSGAESGAGAGAGAGNEKRLRENRAALEMAMGDSGICGGIQAQAARRTGLQRSRMQTPLQLLQSLHSYLNSSQPEQEQNKDKDNDKDRSEKVFATELSKIQKNSWVHRSSVGDKKAEAASTHGLPPQSKDGVSNFSSLYPTEGGGVAIGSQYEVSEQFEHEMRELYCDITELLRHFYGSLNRPSGNSDSSGGSGSTGSTGSTGSSFRDKASLDKAEAILKRLCEDKMRALDARKRRIKEYRTAHTVSQSSSSSSVGKVVDLTEPSALQRKASLSTTKSLLSSAVDLMDEPYSVVLSELVLLIRRAEIAWNIFSTQPQPAG